MKTFISAAFIAAAFFFCAKVLADTADTPSILDTNPIYADLTDAPSTPPPAPPQRGPALPFHTVEGYGGGAFTPMAYLADPPLGDHAFALPAVAFSYINLGQKDVEALTLTENLFGRLELGFGADRLGLGALPGEIRKATGINIQTDDLWMYNLNVRGLIIPENSFASPWVPALTAGVQYKHNDGIANVNSRLGGAFNTIGYRYDDGVDFTLTASKTFANVFGRPLIVSAGGRMSEAAQIGFLGFSDTYRPSFEGNIVYLPTNWLVVAYEYRQKSSPYGQIPGLIGKENDWHGVSASWLVDPQTDLTAGIGYFGVLANARCDTPFWVQLKHDF